MRPRGSSGALFVYMSLKSVPYIRGYSKVLNLKLDQIKAEAVRLEIPEAEK